ncbi:hypothetical protein [Bizionia arctica]|uniref:TonB C-terminal domain-containing protein n=1 Tax=Bizionia arctica TaxID=1495645 RepID=A0A917GPG9_9FLAO|nr:hypothetical protein [Bizionia arctica]GGG53519.1 hypothetical protein GCM10010976_25630 [Bizionia arctica]
MKFKYLLTLCFCLFLGFIVIAQNPIKLKKITKKNFLISTSYQVLKSDKETKQGYYKEYNLFHKMLVVSGNYHLNKKDGLWQEWFTSTRLPRSIGYYKDGKKVGVWEYYEFVDGKKLHTYNYDTNTLLYASKHHKTSEYHVIVNGEIVWDALDNPPLLIGEFSYTKQDIGLAYITLKKKHPDKKDFFADVDILIRKDGSIGDIKATTSFSNPDFLDILKAQINETRGEWLPAELHGEKVDAYVSMRFKLGEYF